MIPLPPHQTRWTTTPIPRAEPPVVTAALWRHVEPHLDRLGALAGDELDRCARLADRHVPVLHQRDRFGRDEQWIEYHPAYRELERVAYGEFGLHAMSHRPGVLGWPDTYPSVAKH